jgi:DNA-binding NtrC family response regulator
MLTLPGPSLPEKPLLLIVDDDALICDSLSFSMTPLFEVVTSHSRPHCLQLLRQLRRAPELALVDLGLPPAPHRPDEGFALISDLLKVAPEIRIVVLSGQSDDGNARHARTLGAADFVAKPCDPGDLQQVLKGALAFRALDERHREGASPLIGNSPAMQKLRVQLRQYADLPFPVLIEGESGSGKEIIASGCLHYETRRRLRPFLALNCAAISPNLVEATCLAMAGARSPAPSRPKPATSKMPLTARFFSTRLANSPWTCRRSCCECWKTASTSG